MFRSLKGRFFGVASLVMVVFLGATGWILDQAYRNSLTEAKRQELKLHIHTLLVVAEPSGKALYLPEQLPEARFNQLSSGLYAIVKRRDGDAFWRSASALGVTLPASESLKRGQQRFQLLPQREWFVFSHGYSWDVPGQTDREFTFTVYENSTGYLSQVNEFRITLWQWLGGAAVLLLLVQVGVMQWGLAPVRRIERDLHAIEQGQADQLAGDYPTELKGLAASLNILVANERRQRDRYRHTMGDLAHSLKTPLAVLNGLNFDQPSEDVRGQIQEQVGRMNQIVGYQLQRAVATSPKSVLKGVPVKPALEKMIRSLEKVYRDKDLNIKLDAGDNTLFHGDEGDLMEILGNLLDNACKYGHGKVHVSAHMEEDGHQRLQIVVDDNGPGIAESRRGEILQRGVRADSRDLGQGIGLAVVNDIVNAYNGELAIAESETLGGSRFELQL